jgi:hypothetical protein
VGGNNKTVATFTGGSTSGTANVASYSASFSEATQQWTAPSVPVLRTTGFADSGARATVVFTNQTFTYVVGAAYGINLLDSTNDGWSSSTNQMGNVLPAENTQYASPPPQSNQCPRIRIVDASGNFIKDVLLRWLSTQAGDGAGTVWPQFYFQYTDTNGADVNVFLATRSTSPLAPTAWGSHPDMIAAGLTPAQSTGYRLPTGIGRRFQGGWITPLSGTLPTGSGYSHPTTPVYLARFPSTGGGTQQPNRTTLTFGTIQVAGTDQTINLPRTLQSWSITAPGSSWNAGDTGYIQFASRPEASNATPAPASYSAAQKLTLTVVQTAPGQVGVTGAVASINVTDGGSKFLVPPTIDYQGTGYGLVLQSNLTNQSITLGTGGITVVNGGAGFVAPPALSIRTGGAQAVAVMRPTMVGTYQCAYRYYDGSVPETSGGPTYSSFSDITPFNAGPALDYLSTNAIQWSLNPLVTPPSRATGVELWRTSSDQSLVFYRVAVLPTLATGLVFTDRLSDEQLFNPDRENYAAMPVVLPNGELNAYRFGQPRTDMAVCVAFQDRMFYGVSTSGEKINSIFYSEFDEFESCPDVNEITIQQNIKQSDDLTALAPFGGQLIAFQRQHCYSLTYLQDPSVDGNLQLMAFRGCINQQSWEIYDGLIYAVDEDGVYTLSNSGQVQDLSAPIHDLFENGLAINSTGQSDNFIHLKIDPSTQILRVFCTLPGDTVPQNYHASALCYSLETETWWVERYSRVVSCATHLKDQQNRLDCVYGGNSRIVYLDYGYTDFQRLTIQSFQIANAGSGYTSPPNVVMTTATGLGGVFQTVLNDQGGVKAIIVKSGGTNYQNGSAFTVTGGGGGSGCTGTITSANSTVANSVASNITSIPWWFQTGNMELITDRESARDGNQKSRAVALTYKPTLDSRNVHLRLYYNNSVFPRDNFARRDRGTGFVEDISGNSSVLDMKSDRTGIGAEATGVSIARFAGRGFDDSVQTDRHVSVEIGSDPPLPLGSTQEVEANAPIIYEVDVQGVLDQP